MVSAVHRRQNRRAELSSANDLSAIRSQMLSFSKGYNPSKFNNTYSFKYNLEGSILQYAEGVSGTSSDSGGCKLMEGRHSAKQNRMELFCIPTDGYENKTARYPLRQKTLTRILIMKQILRHTMLFQTGDSLYTLVSDENWSLMIPLSEKQAAKLADRTVVRVKFLKDDMTQSGDFSIVEIDGAKYGQD